MNQGQGNTGGMYSWVCQSCGQTILSGTVHACGGGYPQPFPGGIPVAPLAAGCRAPWGPPLTAEDVRKIIREELDRKPEPTPSNGI